MSNAQYFAQINDEKVVIDVAVVSSDFMQNNPERYPGTWIETFIDRADKTYAGIGYIYDPLTDDFTPPPIES